LLTQIGTPSGRPKYDVLITDCGTVEGFDFELAGGDGDDDEEEDD
jgi:hypothetical protein